TLIVMGAIGLGPTLVSESLRFVDAVSSRALMSVLAGPALFFQARGRRLPRGLLATVAGGFAGWALWRHGREGKPRAPPGSFTLPVLLIALASLPGTVRRRWRLAGMLLSAAAIILPLLSLGSTWFPSLAGIQMGVKYHVRTAETVVLLAATASF